VREGSYPAKPLERFTGGKDQQKFTGICCGQSTRWRHPATGDQLASVFGGLLAKRRGSEKEAGVEPSGRTGRGYPPSERNDFRQIGRYGVLGQGLSERQLTAMDLLSDLHERLWESAEPLISMKASGKEASFFETLSERSNLGGTFFTFFTFLAFFTVFTVFSDRQAGSGVLGSFVMACAMW
jgi:hypothetical protein